MTWELSKDAVFSKIDGEVVIMSLKSDSYIGLNEVGTRIWELLNEAPRSTADIVNILLNEYEVDESTCRAEVEAYLGDLHKRGLVEVSTGE